MGAKPRKRNFPPKSFQPISPWVFLWRMLALSIFSDLVFGRMELVGTLSPVIAWYRYCIDINIYFVGRFSWWTCLRLPARTESQLYCGSRSSRLVPFPAGQINTTIPYIRDTRQHHMRVILLCGILERLGSG